MNISGENRNLPQPDQIRETTGPSAKEALNPIRTFAILAISIFLIDLLIILVFLFAPKLPDVLESLLDATALTILVSPILYRFAILPLYEQITNLRKLTESQEHLNATLEERVRERTALLEKVEKHATQLETVSSVASAIASVQDLNTLLPDITKLVSDRFGFYHVGIFLTDEKNEYAVLQATNSEGGRQSPDRGHRLHLDENSIVGFVTSRAEPRIALDVGADSVHFDNPDLPLTRSEMALPLRVGGQVIGALDVQSAQPNAFAQEDIDVLATLADQIAIAIENARLFGRLQKALLESQETFDKYVKEEWVSYARQTKHTGFVFDGKQAVPLPDSARRAPIEAVTQTDSLSPERAPSTVAVPIKLRGQTIGVLDVRSKKGQREWTAQEITLLEAAAERAALALENARLLESSQRSAARERSIGEISSRIGAVSDIDAIMRTAVEELGRKVGGATEVTLELDTEEEHSL